MKKDTGLLTLVLVWWAATLALFLADVVLRFDLSDMPPLALNSLCAFFKAGDIFARLETYGMELQALRESPRTGTIWRKVDIL